LLDSLLQEMFGYYDMNSYGLSRVLEDDIPSSVRQAAKCYGSWQPDDVTFKSLPDTQYVVRRDYRRHAPAYTWLGSSVPLYSSSWYPSTSISTPSTSFDTNLGLHDNSGSLGRYTSERSNGYIHDDYLSLGSKERYSHPRPYLYIESDPSVRGSRYGGRESVLLVPEGKRERPYFLQSVLPSSYTGAGRYKTINSEFPFKKYRSDFVPFAPYPRLYDSVKYVPNPDWSGYYGYRYRKARFNLEPEEQTSSRSRAIEQSMREARLRELCKGVYSTSYGNSIKTKVESDHDESESKVLNKNLTPRRQDPDISSLIQGTKSLEAETAPSQGEKSRKHLSLADKRRRNETLAIGLTNESLVKKQEGASDKPSDNQTVTIRIEKVPNPGKPEESTLSNAADVYTSTSGEITNVESVAVTNAENEAIVQPVQTEEDTKSRPLTVKDSHKEVVASEPENDLSSHVEPGKDDAEIIANMEAKKQNDSNNESVEVNTDQNTVEEDHIDNKEADDSTETKYNNEDVISSQEEEKDLTPIIIESEPIIIESEPAASAEDKEEEIINTAETTEEIPIPIVVEQSSPEVDTNIPIKDNTTEDNLVQTIEGETPTDAEARNEDIEIVVKTETSTMIDPQELTETTTSETVTTVNEDGSKTIETVITEYSTTGDTDQSATMETTITTVRITSDADDDLDKEKVFETRTVEIVEEVTGSTTENENVNEESASNEAIPIEVKEETENDVDNQESTE